MPAIANNSKTLGNKYVGQLQNIKNETVLLLALDEVKNEFVSSADIQIDIPKYNEEHVDAPYEQSFMARRCIYTLLKSIGNSTDGYNELESNLEKSELPFTFKNSLRDVCKAMLITKRDNFVNETALIPDYISSSWSVDIDLSSSYAKKLLETSVMLNLELKGSNGKGQSTSTFMMTSDKFNELRFKVADALKSLQDLKKRKMFAPS